MITEVLARLNRLLYPIARAFKYPFGGFLDRLHSALGTMEAQAYNDALATLHAILPDNDNFTLEDATMWAEKYGVLFSDQTPLATRMAALRRKINHPGTIKARQNWRYVQAQLQAAGFDVYVHENRFPSSPVGTFQTLTPNQLFGTTTSEAAVHDTLVQHGQVQHGGGGFPKVANYIEAERDAFFIIGGGTAQRSTFYIAGPTVTTYADVPAEREKEFRQLIHFLKPRQTVAYLVINYV